MRRWRKKMSKRSGRLSYCEDFLSRCSRTDRMSCRSSASLDPPSSHLRHLSCVCSQTASPWTWALNKRQTGGIILHLCETRGSDRFILDRSSCSWVPLKHFQYHKQRQAAAQMLRKETRTLAQSHNTHNFLLICWTVESSCPPTCC